MFTLHVNIYCRGKAKITAHATMLTIHLGSGLPMCKYSMGDAHILLLVSLFSIHTHPLSQLNDFLELKVCVSVKVVQICADNLMTEHIVVLVENENKHIINVGHSKS